MSLIRFSTSSFFKWKQSDSRLAQKRNAKKHLREATPTLELASLWIIIKCAVLKLLEPASSSEFEFDIARTALLLQTPDKDSCLGGIYWEAS